MPRLEDFKHIFMRWIGCKKSGFLSVMLTWDRLQEGWRRGGKTTADTFAPNKFECDDSEEIPTPMDKALQRFPNAHILLRMNGLNQFRIGKTRLNVLHPGAGSRAASWPARWAWWRTAAPAAATSKRSLRTSAGNTPT